MTEREARETAHAIVDENMEAIYLRKLSYREARIDLEFRIVEALLRSLRPPSEN